MDAAVKLGGQSLDVEVTEQLDLWEHGADRGVQAIIARQKIASAMKCKS